MRDSAIQLSLVVLALAAISCAVGIRDGTAAPGALPCLTIGLIALVLAGWVRPEENAPSTKRWVDALLIGALLGILVFHFCRPMTILRLFSPRGVPIVLILVAVGMAASVAAFFTPARARFLLTVIVLGCGAIAWTVTLNSAIQADVQSDVMLFQQRAAGAMLAGRNPYAIDMPNMYGANSPFYASGMVHGNEVQTGYPYPPLTLLAAMTGQWLGDVRWPLVLAGALSGCMLAWIRPGPRSTASAALFLFAMPALFILPLGYTDVELAGVMIATVLSAVRFPRAVPILLGVLLGTKQYAIVLLPAMMLLAPHPWSIRRTLRWFWPAILVAVLLVLPAFAFDFGAAWRSMVLFHLHQPFRSDSLGYLPLLGETAGGRVSGIAPWIALLPATVLIWMRGGRSASGFCIGSALLIAVFFAFGKQAFANYYFFVIACLCGAIATAKSTGERAGGREAALRQEPDWTTPVPQP